MKSESLQNQLHEIEAELVSLAPISDSELEAQVAAGADAAQLVDEDNRRSMRRRVLNIQQQAVFKQLAAAIKDESAPKVDKHLKEREKAVEAARKALQNAHAAIDAFAAAMAEWDKAASEAEAAGARANSTAKQGMLPKPVSPVSIGSQEFHEMDKRFFQIIRPQRISGVQLGKEQVEA